MKLSTHFSLEELTHSVTAHNRGIDNSPSDAVLKGQAADITSLANTPEENKRLFDCAVRLIESGKIRVGQCIDEYGYKWVHISTPFRKVNQVLHLR